MTTLKAILPVTCDDKTLEKRFQDSFHWQRSRRKAWELVKLKIQSHKLSRKREDSSEKFSISSASVKLSEIEVDCEKSLFFFQFREGSIRARETKVAFVFRSAD